MPPRNNRRKNKSLLVRIEHSIRNRLITGFLVVVPLGITFLLLRLLYDLTAGYLASAIQPIMGELPGWAVGTVSVFLFLLILYGVGFVANFLIGRRLIAIAEAVMYRIPLVKTVYGASKQVVESLSFSNQEQNFKSVVLIEFPRAGMYSIGFLTGVIRLESNAEMHAKVFIPTTPNPTTGYLEILPLSQVYVTGFTVEDAVKTLMSGGIVAPDTIAMTRASEVEEIAGRRQTRALPAKRKPRSASPTPRKASAKNTAADAN